MSWLRLDDNFLSHPKVRCLSDPQLRVWLRMLSVCSQHDDATVDKHVVAEVKGLGDSLLERFAEIGLLDETPHGYKVHNWSHYRPKDATAAERMRNYRNRKRNANRNTDRNENVTRARDVPDPTPEPYAVGTSDVDLKAGSTDPATNRTTNKGDPVHRLLAELPDADDGTEQVLRSFNLPEAAYERAREDTRAHGGTTGYAVAILRRIKDEGRLATDEEDAPRTNVQPADPVASIRAMIHNGAITERAVLDAELRAANLNGQTAATLISELDEATR